MARFMGGALHVTVNGVDLSGYVKSVTYNPDPRKATIFFTDDPTEGALRELLIAAGIEPDDA